MGLINNSTDPSSVLQDPGNPDRAPSTASGHRVINRGGYKARDPCGICPLPRSGFSVMSPGAPARWLESTDGLRSASKHFLRPEILCLMNPFACVWSEHPSPTRPLNCGSHKERDFVPFPGVSPVPGTDWGSSISEGKAVDWAGH